MASVSLTSSIDFLPKFGIAASSFSDLETRSPIVSIPTRLRQLYERTPSSSSSIAAAGALTRYVLDVVPSATGGLSSASEQAVTVTFPTGTTFTRWDGGDLFDRELNATVGNCSAPDANRRSFCSLFGNVIIAPGDHLRITFYGVDNPSTAGARSVDVATTSDTVAAASPSYDIAPRGAIDNLAVTAGDLTPGAVTNYVVTFAASATGGLSRPPDASAITLTLPPGTGIPAFPTTSVVDVEQARTVGRWTAWRRARRWRRSSRRAVPPRCRPGRSCRPGRRVRRGGAGRTAAGPGG